MTTVEDTELRQEVPPPSAEQVAAAALGPKNAAADPAQPAAITDEIDAAAIGAQEDSSTLPQLQQLKRRQQNARKVMEEVHFDYKYTERESMEVELDEWYMHAEDFRLLQTCRWVATSDIALQALLPWQEASDEAIGQYIQAQLTILTHDFVAKDDKRHAIATLAGIAQATTVNWSTKEMQLHHIRRNVRHLRHAGAYPILVKTLRALFDDWYSYCDEPWSETQVEALRQADEDVRQVLTTLYFMLEAVAPYDDFWKQISEPRQCIISLLLETLARPRGTPEVLSAQLPMLKIALLLRKAMLVSLGEQLEVAKCKQRQRERFHLPKEQDATAITASADEYAQFRAEIASKYPMFKPSTLIPERSDIKQRPDRSQDLPTYTDGQWSSTPAPSPPPSPRGRKGIFQTDQTLPFPLPWNDDLDNKVPKSVEEATLMFHTRQKRTVAETQLGQASDALMRLDRGWSNHEAPKEADFGDSPEDLTLARVHALYQRCLPNLSSGIAKLVDSLYNAARQLGANDGPNGETSQTNGARPLNGHVKFQRPNLTSANSFGGNFDPGPDDVNAVQGWLFGDKELPCQEELQKQLPNGEQAASLAQHHYQVLCKGVSGFLLLLLQWSRVSHVLKFEFICECLMDADWVAVFQQTMLSLDPLKVLNNSAIQAPPASFFSALQRLPGSDLPPASDVIEQGFLDELRDLEATHQHRRQEYERLTAAREASPFKAVPMTSQKAVHDTDDSTSPSTVERRIPRHDTSSRILFCATTLCKLLHKCTKKKTSRAHHLLQHRIWLELRKPLRVQQEQLQEIVLKLYKTQVPLCSRKWRSTNMKVITQIYMACKPDLRDDWISGGEYGGVMSGFAAANAMGAMANGHDLDMSEAKAADERLRRLVWHYNQGIKQDQEQLPPLSELPKTDHNEDVRVVAQDADDEKEEEEDFFERELTKRFAAMAAK